MENKFINRYNTFCRCLENLKKSQKADPEADFVLEGTVQNFKVHQVPVPGKKVYIGRSRIVSKKPLCASPLVI